MRRLERLSAIAGEFDGFLIDQFGVIHDGRTLYPGALEVLAGLAAASKPVVILTNSGKRAAANRDRIVAIGVPRSHFVDAISSGEVAYRSLQPVPALIIGKDGEDYGFDGFAAVTDPAAAKVMLILGSNAPKTSLDDYRRLLAGLTLPAICCNPDKLMLTPSGLQPAPGAIGALYEEMGGTVSWIGKPYPGIYHEAVAMLGLASAIPRILAIGDSAEHDVAGAHAAGHAALLVMTGVSAGKDPASLSPEPEMLMDQLRW